MSISNPIIVNDAHVGTIASADSLDKAADIAVHEMVRMVAEKTGASEAELVILLSLIANAQVCQMVDPKKTVRFMVPIAPFGIYGGVFNDSGGMPSLVLSCRLDRDGFYRIFVCNPFQGLPGLRAIPAMVSTNPPVL